MRLHIVAVGRLRSGPELDLIKDYRQRAERTGRPLGISSVTVVEVDERKGGCKAGEAALLEKAVPKGAVVVALDECGRAFSRPPRQILSRP